MWFSWYQIVIWICSSLAFGLITISAGWYWCVYGGACYELSWSSGKNTQQNGICIAKSHLSQNPSEKDVPGLQDSWRSKQELVSDTLLWTPQHGYTSIGHPTRTYIDQLCDYSWCLPEDLPNAMNDRTGWRARFKNICFYHVFFITVYI